MFPVTSSYPGLRIRVFLAENFIVYYAILFIFDLSSMDTFPVGGSSASLAALAVLLLLILLIYPLGVLIAKYWCFRDKSETILCMYVCMSSVFLCSVMYISCILVGYCEVFWCGGCCRKGQNTCTCVHIHIDIQLVLNNISGSVDVTYSIMRINSTHIKYAQLQCPYELVVV